MVPPLPSGFTHPIVITPKESVHDHVAWTVPQNNSPPRTAADGIIHPSFGPGPGGLVLRGRSKEAGLALVDATDLHSASEVRTCKCGQVRSHGECG